MKIYAFSGLGADQRIFTYLKPAHEIVPVRWIDPLPNEGLVCYAKRLSEQIDSSEEFGLLGVSFGGMLATEVAKQMKPEVTLLISSASTHEELPIVATWARRWNWVDKIPVKWFKPPEIMAWVGFPFNKRNRLVAQGIIRDTDPHFVKWALGAIVTWESTGRPENLFHIRGRLDPILPNKRRMHAEKAGSGHFIILKNATEVTDWINKCLKTRNY